MKTLVTILFALVLPFAASATAQVGDRIIWKGDTLMLYSNPLELRQDIGSLRPVLFANREAGMSTGCWRGYVAEWKIIDDELFLTNIYSCNYHEDKVKADLQKVFGPEYVNGKVKATWVTGELLIPKGKLIHYVHSGYGSFYEKELVLTFKNGQLTDQQEYDNSRSHKSVYSQNEDSLQSFIYSNINWAKLLMQKSDDVRVIVSFQTGDKPQPSNLKIVRKSANEAFNQEALRVVKMLPDWDVYYRRGEVVSVPWIMPIIFSAENKAKYGR
ncbi:energy transducer TonB family protein [Pontibacter harenae]|uniref:energy transducer TonB family protein n=1 Tax=Pontibacter harenae TaxID=2894083 RepID=UPI001E6248C0|nr:energy transducer TonB [Pontibacter harenae]MCC9166092.1 energy transducer TonB [Pontibacter harenae]